MFKILRKKSEAAPHPVVIAYIDAIKEDPTRIAAPVWSHLKQKIREELSNEEREWFDVELKKIRLDHLNVEIARLRLMGDTGKDQSKVQTNLIVTGRKYSSLFNESVGV